jgi:hypothetical protein
MKGPETGGRKALAGVPVGLSSFAGSGSNAAAEIKRRWHGIHGIDGASRNVFSVVCVDASFE